jgi:hypothetical protein
MARILKLVATMTGHFPLLAFLVACATSSTTIEQQWHVRSSEARPRNVVTLYSSRDGAVRRTIEDEMAVKLRRGGVAATPAYSVLSPDVRDHGETRDALLALGYDGVVFLRPVGDSPDDATAMASHDGGDPFPMASTADVGLHVEARLQVAVYSLADDRLVYAALSKTLDPDSTPIVIDEVTSLVTHELARQDVLVATRAPLR